MLGGKHLQLARYVLLSPPPYVLAPCDAPGLTRVAQRNVPMQLLVLARYNSICTFLPPMLSHLPLTTFADELPLCDTMPPLIPVGWTPQTAAERNRLENSVDGLAFHALPPAVQAELLVRTPQTQISHVLLASVLPASQSITPCMLRTSGTMAAAHGCFCLTIEPTHTSSAILWPVASLTVCGWLARRAPREKHPL